MTSIPVPLKAGALIRQLRKDRGLSQEELAKRSGLTRAGISLIERCARGAHIRSVRDVLEALGYELVACPRRNGEDIAE